MFGISDAKYNGTFPQPVEACRPNYEKQAEKAAEDAKRLGLALDVIADAPHVDVDHQVAQEFYGAVSLEKRRAEARRDNALKMLERDE